MTDLTHHEGPQEPSTTSKAGRTRKVFFIASLVLFVGAGVVAITGTIANNQARDDREMESEALRTQQETVDDAATRLRNAREELEDERIDAQSVSESIYAYLGPASEAVTISERDMQIAREMREVSLSPDRGVDRFNQLTEESNSTVDRYNELIDQLNRQLDELRHLVSAAT